MVNVEDFGFSITVANELNDKADSVLVITVDDEDVRFVENSSATVKSIDIVKKSRFKRCWNCRKYGHVRKFCTLSRINVIYKRLCYHCRMRGHMKYECPMLE